MIDDYLDTKVVDELSRCKSEGLYKALPEDIERRQIQGTKSFILQYHPSWDSTKRSAFNKSPSMIEPFDSTCFSFDKVRLNEILFKLSWNNDSKSFKVYDNKSDIHSDFDLICYINVSPVSKNQHLYVPNPELHYPQIYNPDFLHYFLAIFKFYKSDDYALFFNSLNAWASVNHQHWHGLFIHDFVEYDTILPIQKQHQTIIKESSSLSVCSINDWICHTIVIKNKNEDNNTEFIRLVNKSISICYQLLIPFNFMITNHGKEFYLFLRTPQTNVDDIGYRAAFAELCGMTIVRKHDAFLSLTEESILSYSHIFRISENLYKQFYSLFISSELE